MDVLSVRQLADCTGIPRSTVHALCATLSAEGLLELVPRLGYRLGPTLLELGGQIVERAGLVEAAAPVMDRLPRIRGLEAHLGQLVGGWVVYLHHRSFDSPRLPMINWVGLHVPAFRTGCGRAALSMLEAGDLAARIQRLVRAEHVQPPDTTALNGELAIARRHGFAVSRAFQHGRTSIAAPVVGPDGAPLGGLSVAGPSALFTPRFTEQTAQDVKVAAAQTSARLMSEHASQVHARTIRWRNALDRP